MSVRTRTYIAIAAGVLLAFGLTRVAHAADWSKGEMYAVGAVLLGVYVVVALPWIELAPDGDLRRPRPR
jgi:branched-subunit amino acid ABC-type transport system permease component